MREAPKLFVRYTPAVEQQQEDLHTDLTAADGVVIAPGICAPEQHMALPVEHALLIDGDPERDAQWLVHDNCHWVCTRGLTETARLRDQWPELNWVPQLTVYKPAVSYRFSGPAIGEGFSFYIPDTTTIKGWQVTDGDVSLTDAVNQAIGLGFSALWLDSQEAEARGRGLALEMLERISHCSLPVWLSGGVTAPDHLQNLVRLDRGGAAAVVVNEELVRDFGMDPLRQALTPPARHQDVPVPVVAGEVQVSIT